MALTTSILQGGTNSHATTSEEVNYVRTDLMSPGVVGVLTNTSGVAPATGGFAVNAQGTPDATVAVSAGVATVTATPTSGNSQLLRVKNSATSNVTISANSTGGTRYDWIYVKIDPDKAKDPASDASDVATLVSSRSTSATTDNGTPPTYGTLLAVVTVANGFSTITNGNIADKRVRAVAVGGLNDTNGNEAVKISATASAVNEVTVTNAATGNAPTISATGDDTNIHLSLTGKGTGGVLTKNPYKFSVYRNAAWSTPNNTTSKVQFDTKNFDTGSNFDATTNYRFTAPIAGFYFFTATVGAASSATNCYAVLYVNGSEYRRGPQIVATAVIGASVSSIISLNASDYVEVYIFDTSTHTGSTGNSKTFFDGYLVSAT